jgi:signal peptidase II
MSKKFLVSLLIGLSVIAVDQLSKFWARHSLVEFQNVPIIQGVLNFKLLFNDGAAFSMLSGQQNILALFSFLVSTFIVFHLWKNQNKLTWNETTFLGLILGGAVGNFIDRIYFHKVTDFIDLLLLPGDFPIFNLADVSINIAVAVAIGGFIFQKFFNRQSE